MKTFRYGQVMPGRSRIVMDLRPRKIEQTVVLDAANGQPPRLVVEVDGDDRAAIEASPLRSRPRAYDPGCLGRGAPLQAL